MDTFNNHLHLQVTKVDDSARVLAALKVLDVSLTAVLHTHTSQAACFQSKVIFQSAVQALQKGFPSSAQ